MASGWTPCCSRCSTTSWPSSLPRMAEFLHTMVRITDPERSRAFYEALGFEFERDMDIVRNGEREATNYFYGIGDSKSVLELTYNHDGRTYELGTGYGHIALAVDDLAASLETLKKQGIEPEREPYRMRERNGAGRGGGSRTACARAGRCCASSTTPTATASRSSIAAGRSCMSE